MKTALAIDVGASTIKGAIVSGEGVLRDRREITTDSNRVIDQLIDFVKQFNLLDADAIGVGFPGIIENGVVLSATNLANVENFPLAQKLTELTQKKVVVANDADMALAGERWLGVAKDKKKVVLLTLGSGIGGALTDKPNSELGHSVIDPGSVLTCNQGHRGDIEALIGGLVTEKRLGRPMADLLGDPVYQQTFVDKLTQAINFLINQYNPELVVVGGGIMQSASFFFNKLPHFSVPLAPAKLGQDAGIFGAAKVAMQGGLK